MTPGSAVMAATTTTEPLPAVTGEYVAGATQATDFGLLTCPPEEVPASMLRTVDVCRHLKAA